MLMQVTIDPGAPFGWETAFLFLGLRCCRPALRAMGVPPAMVANPDPLQAAATRALEAGLGNWIGLFYEDGVIERVGTEALSELAVIYGEREVQLLYDWAGRHLTDHSQRVMWSNWYSFFLRMASMSAGGIATPAAPSPLAGVEKRIMKVVRAHCGPRAFARDEALEEEVRSLGYTAWEERLVALDPLEPDYPTQQDIPLLVNLVLGAEHTYEVWRELDRMLSPLQRLAMQEWYQRLGSPYGSPLPLEVLEAPPLAEEL